MKVAMYCNGKLLETYESNNDLLEIGQECAIEFYDSKNQLYCYRLYRIIGVSFNRIDLTPLLAYSTGKGCTRQRAPM